MNLNDASSFYLNARRIDYCLHTDSIDHMINFSHDCRLSIVTSKSKSNTEKV